MIDRQISAGSAIAWMLWTASLGLWILSLFFDERPIVSAAVILAMAGSTATIRCYLCEQAQRIKSAMAVTQTVDTTVRSLH